MLDRFQRSLQHMRQVLGSGTPRSDSVNVGQALAPIEDIRQSLLECLGERGSARFPAVERRIWLENDVRGLWHLRSDVMAALSDLYGEVAALERLHRITPLFAGHLASSSAVPRGTPVR